MNWFYRCTGYRRGERHLVVPFVLVTTLFFFWAFVHNINGTLIPHLRKALLLSDTQSAFIDVTIYIAYFLAAIPAGLLIQRKRYRVTILSVLSLFAIGALPYLVLAAAIGAVILLFVRQRIPEVSPEGDGDTGMTFSRRVLHQPNRVLAVVAQFFYVGAQIGVGSFFVRFSQQTAGLTDKQAGFLWGQLRHGRLHGGTLRRHLRHAVHWPGAAADALRRDQRSASGGGRE
jgi:fucose permease